MTDKEIIQAHNGCIKNMLECTDCPYGNHLDCMSDIYDDIIDLLNRQQAEIERLKSENIMAVEISFDENEIREQLEKIKAQKTICIDNTESIRAEAIKDFAEKLKKTLTGWVSRPTDLEIKFAIDKVGNEMVGAGNG